MADLNGKTIGKYKILERLGQGGMAEVYKGYHPSLERHVAIKILHSYLADAQDFVGRFQREARAIAALRHPNIVQVFDFDVELDHYYMVMEFVDGPTLKSRVQEMQERGENLPPAEVVRIFKALGSAIDYAHSRGVVHRDIKPANIIFDHEGSVYLTDFGIAYIVGGSRFTVTGGITGTPTYMAPEQGMGSAGDERSDLYSLGVILYEILTGTVPFDAATPIGIIMKHLNEPLPRPSLIRPDLPPAVERVVLRALSKEPQDRYPTASALAQALEVAFVTGDETLVERAAPEKSAPKAAARRPQSPPHHPPPPTDQATIVSRGHGPWTTIPLIAGVGVLVCIVALIALFVVYPRTAHAPTIVVPTVMDLDDLPLGATFVPAEGPAVALEPSPDASAVTSPAPPALSTQPVSPLTAAYTTVPVSTTTDTPSLSLTGAPPASPVPASGVASPVASGVASPVASGVPAHSEPESTTESTNSPTATHAATPATAPLAAATPTALAPTTTLQATETSAPTATATPPATGPSTATATPSATGTSTAAATPSATSSLTAVATPSATGTATATATPSATGTSTAAATPSATGTSTATATPEATDTSTATRTPRPTPAPLIVPTNTAPAAAISGVERPAQAGLITAFDDLVTWKRVRQSSGTLAESASRLHGSAPHSAELSYQFKPGNDFVIFERAYPLGGRPVQISAWVYGDGSGIFLSCWISDVDQEVWQFSFGQVKHTGWRLMTATLNPQSLSGANRLVSGAITATMDYPLDFQALVLDHAPGSSSASGKIYVSELAATEVLGLVQPTEAPASSATAPATKPARPTARPAATARSTAAATLLPAAKSTPPATAPVAAATVAPPTPTVAGPTIAPSVPLASWVPPTGHLAFVVFKPGMSKATYDLYVSKIDGTERRLAWEWARQPQFRRWDGRLVFAGDGQGKDNLWSMNLDGSDAREVSMHPEDAHPTWSPKGDRLLFDSEFYTWGASAAQRIWTIWTNDTDQKGIEPKSVQVAGRVIAGRSPVWLSNDWIAYTGCNYWAGGGSCGLYTAPSWGADTARQLTSAPEDVASDSFGDRIVYTSHADGNWEVYAINFDGNGRQNLSAHAASDGLPSFSPDGRHIAFISDRSGAWAVWVMNPDGSAPTKLFDLPGTLGPDWTSERISWGP